MMEHWQAIYQKMNDHQKRLLTKDADIIIGQVTHYKNNVIAKAKIALEFLITHGAGGRGIKGNPENYTELELFASKHAACLGSPDLIREFYFSTILRIDREAEQKCLQESMITPSELAASQSANKN